jgi:gamma-glutamyl-gamma-aminobutyrate hydrolase PuuD
MPRKTIGIVGWSTGAESIGVSKPYLEHLKHYGDVVILTPNAFIPTLDLLVLPGGKDVVNGGKGEFSYYNSDAERFLEHFDHFTLPKYIDAGIPIWGTCRGFQTLCKHFGLAIEQDLIYHITSKDNEDGKANDVFIPNEKFHRMLPHTKSKRPYYEVGSWHHQGVLVREFNDDNCQLEIIGVSNDKLGEENVVEFMKHKTLPICGAQGHIERDYNQLGTFLFESLLNIETANPALFYGQENV